MDSTQSWGEKRQRAYLARIEADLEVGLESNTLLQPVAHIDLLLCWGLELELVRIQQLLVRLRQPWDDERNLQESRQNI